MLDRVLSFLKELPSAGAKGKAAKDDDPRIAAAALMYHVMNADGVRHDAEWERIKDLLGEAYDLTGDALDELAQAGEAADLEAVDLYQFTSLLNRSCDDEGRRKVVEMMFQVAYADGQLSEFEDNIVWRASELMHVPSRDRVTIRRQVREQNTQDEN